MEKESNAHIQQLSALLVDRDWRLKNLYLILDEVAGTKPFIARPEQLEFRRNRHTRNFVPKARKLGISTEIVLENLDELIFTPNLRAGIVDLTEDDAFGKLQIARFAWQQGPNHPNPGIAQIWRDLHEANPLVIDTKGEMTWSNGASFEAGTSFTGNTPQRLHWSEAGPLSAQYPDRAAKIKRGTLNSVPPDGIVDVETTMEGGRIGTAYNLFRLAKESAGTDLSPADWKLHFFSWLGHPSYKLPGREPTNARIIKYFRDLKEKHGIAVPLERQAWYEAKEREQSEDMLQQFPTDISECDMAVVLGAIYPDLAIVRQQGRVREFNPEPHLPLFTFWDCGGDSLAGWLIQPGSKEINILNWAGGEGSGAAGLAQQARAWEAMHGPIAMHFVPHDADQHDKGSNKTFKTQMIESGLLPHQIRVVPRIPDVWTGIGYVRQRIPRMWFHKRCDQEVEAAGEKLPGGFGRLENYRKAHNRSSGAFLPHPHKDGICDHSADALRTFAEADAQGLIPGQAPKFGETERDHWDDDRPKTRGKTVFGYAR